MHKTLYRHLLRMFYWYKFLKSFGINEKARILWLTFQSKSQLNQEIFALSMLRFKKNGYFIEFGATDGKKLSNTFLLEKKFKWEGILSEPAKFWHAKLFKLRQVVINTDCIWSESGKELTFAETSNKELSTLESLTGSDRHSQKRVDATQYMVSTISLLDLLKRNKSPKLIDFLSIDTEGSEYQILKTFNFNEYTFNVVVCEHNYGSNKALIDNIFKQNGYLKIRDEMTLWDSWYINQEVLEKFHGYKKQHLLDLLT